MALESTYHFTYLVPGDRVRQKCIRNGTNAIEIWHQLKEELPEAFDIRLEYIRQVDPIDPLVKL
jgi:hypothetical protein